MDCTLNDHGGNFSAEMQHREYKSVKAPARPDPIRVVQSVKTNVEYRKAKRSAAVKAALEAQVSLGRGRLLPCVLIVK